MFNKAHKLKGNKTSAWPQQIIYFDTETDGFNPDITEQHHMFRLGVGYYVSYRNRDTIKRQPEVLKFTQLQSFYNWVLSKVKPKRKLLCMASNVWFDIRVTGIDMFLFDNGWKCTQIYQEGLRTIITLRKDKLVIQFLSIQNFIPYSIEQIGKRIGYEKKEVDFENVSDEVLLDYCVRDVEVLQKGFEYWKDTCIKNDFGCFGKTISAQTFNAFRHRYMKDNIYIHDNITAQEIERQSYFGGRTEAFRLGEIKDTPVYKLDINSLYPYVMRDKQYPTKLIRMFGKIEPPELSMMLEKYAVIAEVDVDIDKPVIPVKHDKRCVFPVGRFKTVLNSESLKRLLAKDQITHIYRGFVYLKSDIFREFVNSFFDLKQTSQQRSDEFETKIYKLMLNSLYGKFGQKRREETYKYKVDTDIVRNEQVLNCADGCVYQVIAYGGEERWTKPVEFNSFNSFNAIASHVTDYARWVLWDAMEQAGIGNYFYCDTDSLFVNSAGYENLSGKIHKTRLGYWKLEETTNDCFIYGAKWYKFGDKTKCKGISPNSVKVDENRYKQQLWPSHKSMLKEGLDTGYTVKTVEKQLTGEYKKGIVTDSGIVFPFVFPLNV